jgi:hypothetical protein
VTNVITEGVFLLWWNHAFEAQNWLPEFGDGFPLALSPAWDIFFWPLNVIVGIAFFLHAYALIRGGLASALADCRDGDQCGPICRRGRDLVVRWAGLRLDPER